MCLQSNLKILNYFVWLTIYSAAASSSPLSPAYAQDLSNANAIVKSSSNGKLTDNSIQVDNKITKTEKEHYAAVAKQSNQYAEQQANVINKVPGVQVSAKDLKEVPEEKGFHPVAWFFKPVTRLQNQSVRLEQQIMKLTGPIAALQPAMLGLEKHISAMQKQMVSMQGQVGNLQGQVGNLENKTTSVKDEMRQMQQDISVMRSSVDQIKKPVMELKDPIISLRDPLLRVQGPITAVDNRLIAVDKELNDLKILMSLVLTAIFVAAAIIAFGTPVAAILIWRNRAKLLPPPDSHQKVEEQSIHEATKVLDRQLKR